MNKDKLQRANTIEHLLSKIERLDGRDCYADVAYALRGLQSNDKTFSVRFEELLNETKTRLKKELEEL